MKITATRKIIFAVNLWKYFCFIAKASTRAVKSVKFIDLFHFIKAKFSSLITTLERKLTIFAQSKKAFLKVIGPVIVVVLCTSTTQQPNAVAALDWLVK